MPNYRKLTKKLTPLVLGIGIPASLRTLSQYIQQIIDTMYIGQYSSDSLLAISSIVIPFWAIESLWIGIAASTTIMIAQRIGAKNHASATKTAQTTFILGAILSLTYFLFWQNMSGLLVRSMNLQGAPAEGAHIYIKTLSFLYLFRFVGISTPASILEAYGNTRIIMFATLTQTITNIVLDPLFIWGWGPIPEMGIQGAALATVFAELTAAIFLSTYFWRHNYLKLKKIPIFPIQWNFSERSQLVIPITVEVAVWSLSTSAIISMMNHAFPMGGAVFNVGFLLSDVCYRILHGFDVANMSLIGRAFGARRKDRIIATLRAVTKSKWLFGIIIMGLAFIFRHTITRMFSQDLGIIQTTLDNFPWILAIAFVNLSVGINFSTLHGMGYSRYCLYVNIIGFPMRMGLSYLILYYTDYGITGIWIAMIFENILRVIVTLLIRNHTLEKYWSRWVH